LAFSESGDAGWDIVDANDNVVASGEPLTGHHAIAICFAINKTYGRQRGKWWRVMASTAIEWPESLRVREMP